MRAKRKVVANNSAFVNVGKVAVRDARKARTTKQKSLTPECFDKKFWDEMRTGLKTIGMSENRYLQILAEVRNELRGRSGEELLKASGITEADIALAKREGRWIEDISESNTRHG